MRASLKNYRQSPRKVRLVADLIRGRKVDEALVLLKHTDKRATDQIEKLLRSAVANAKANGEGDEKSLYISEFRIDGGPSLKRFRPVSRGSAHPYKKRTSNIILVLNKREAEVAAK